MPGSGQGLALDEAVDVVRNILDNDQGGTLIAQFNVKFVFQIENQFGYGQ
jgi:hypothetical protein